jgi:hypothetical protein
MEYCHILSKSEIKDGRLNIRENSLEPAFYTWFEEHTGEIVPIYSSEGSLVRRGATISRVKGRGWRFSCGNQTFDGMRPGDVVIVKNLPDDNLEIEIRQRTLEGIEPTQALIEQQFLSESQTSTSLSLISRNRQRPQLGEPLSFRGLQHTPINEQGVVFLFGMVCKDLGYLVEAVQVGFPDCEGKRRVDSHRWERVRIEFEFKSSNFLKHGHDANLCDLIVCWEHDWLNCPLEVLELRKEIQKLNSVQ